MLTNHQRGILCAAFNLKIKLILKIAPADKFYAANGSGVHKSQILFLSLNKKKNGVRTTFQQLSAVELSLPMSLV